MTLTNFRYEAVIFAIHEVAPCLTVSVYVLCLPRYGGYAYLRTDGQEELLAKFDQELRRGVVLLAVLAQLRTPQYGYSLRRALSDHGMNVEEGTLYPLLRRLEMQGVLASEWRIKSGPPRRYYSLSAFGRKIQVSLLANWRDLQGALDEVLGVDGE
jgi:PadR family transcriptional regulator PadR